MLYNYQKKAPQILALALLPTFHSTLPTAQLIIQAKVSTGGRRRPHVC